MSSPDVPTDPSAHGLPPGPPDGHAFDPAAFEDDARFARVRLAPADPARAPGGTGSSLDARRRLAARLEPAAAAMTAGPGAASPGPGAVMAGPGAMGFDAGAVRRRPSRWLAVPIAAVIALVVGLLVLQPFSKEEPAGAAVVRAAASTTQAAGTARLSATVEAMGQTVTAEGVGDLANGNGRLTVHAPSPVGDVQVIHLGDDLYVSAPDVVGDFLGGATWIHVGRDDLQSLADMAGRNGLGGLDLSVALDPVKAVDYVRGVSGEVTEVGPDDVGGDPATHYSTHLDPAKVADQLGGSADHDELTQALSSVGQIPLDLWIDDAGRLRRVTVSVDLDAVPLPPLPDGGSDGGTRPHGTFTATFELSSFGAPLDATPPSSGDVAEAGPLLGLLNQAMGR